ncbi:MAG: ThuA domain-containing protein, partial [Fimbriimonadaceae bacterium]
KDLFDGLWVWDKSEHSPVEEFDVLTTEKIALTEGVPKTFRIKDELYYNLFYPQRSEVFLKAQYKGEFWPLAWHGQTEGSPMVYLGLGHDLDSTNNPAFKTLLGNALRHLAGQ